MKLNLWFYICCVVYVGRATEPVIEVIKGPEYYSDNAYFNITVQWKDVKYMTAGDYVTVHGCDDPDCSSPEVFMKVPIQYKYVHPDVKPEISDIIFRTDTGFQNLRGKPIHPHTLEFSVLVRSGVPGYQLAYIGGSRQYPELQAISLPVKIPKKIQCQPRNMRLSLVAEEANAMRIIWTESPFCEVSSIVKYNEVGSKEIVSKSPSIKYSFDRENLCEAELYPAGSVGFSSLGNQMEVILNDLKPNAKYEYYIEFEIDAEKLETKKNSFVNTNFHGGSAKMIVFGDMGQSMALLDGSLQHSFDNRNHGEIAAAFTSKLLNSLLTSEDPPVDVINHIGDISYATGQLSLWDSFLYEIEETASKVPWMVGIGNHEIGWAHSDLPGGDSQGECGVPYISLFPFAQREPFQNKNAELLHINHFVMNEVQATKTNQKVIQPYYSYFMKNVAVIMMSTEHDFSEGSQQLEWIEEALQKAQAEVEDESSGIEWILFLGHRPMYISDKFLDISTRHLRKYVEPLLMKYKVDIAIWGHHHSYQTFKCKLYQGKCNRKGVVQIVSGHAGFDHSPFSTSNELDPLFRVKDNKNWGISILDFVNKTHCKHTYKENKNGQDLDSFWITKDSMFFY